MNDKQKKVLSVLVSALTDWVVEGDMRDKSAEVLFQPFLQEALVSSFGMGRDVHSLMLSIQHFLCRPRRCPSSKVPRRMVLERLPWRVTCPNHASFRHWTVTRRDSCGFTRPMIVLRTQSLVKKKVAHGVAYTSAAQAVLVRNDTDRLQDT